MPDAPVKIKNSTFTIETDELLKLTQTPPTERSRRYTYERQSTEESVQDQEVYIRYVVVRNVTNGDEEFKREYQDEKCEIEIYWERPESPTSAS